MIARAVALLLVLAAVVLVALAVRAPAPPEDDLVPADVARGTPAVQAEPLDPTVDLAVWAATTGEATGVPPRALQAYGAAELAQRVATPGCGLSWTTLAGVGRVESDHGQLGAELAADGVSRPRIVGVALDGSEGVREIRDTDGGTLDGDAVFDRAVGPMQFLPTTWARYGADGDGDGVADPHQLDDAARAAAAYLCDGGRVLTTGAGWWDAVLAYNRSGSYARLVWAASARYAEPVNVSDLTSS